MQPNLQTEFQAIANQQGNTVISPKCGFLKGNNELKGEAECFLGMLDKIERVPDENIMYLKELQEKSQGDGNMLDVIVKTEQEICSLIGDMTLKRGNIPELLLSPEQNKEGNEEKPLSSKTAGQHLLKGQSGNGKDFILFGYSGDTETDNSSIDKNTMLTALKAQSDSGAKKSALSEMLNISVKTEENESKTGQGELNKNNEGVQISKGSEGAVSKEAGAQLLKGLEVDIAETIKNSETKGSRTDLQIKHAADIKDVEKAAATNRILMEGTTAGKGGEESKIYNSPHIFENEIKESELSKKDLLLKISTGIKDKEQGSDSLKMDNTSDEKASQQDKEFINLKEGGLKIKASGTEFSSDKIIHMESESKDNGIILPKNLSVEKNPEEIMTGRENKLSSNISRAGTLNQIVEKAALNLKNGKSQVRIELKPEFLGSVRMKITTENHLVTVRILTELPVVKEMIENNISQLKTDLQSHGLEIDKVDVSVADDSQQRGKGFEKADFLSEKENNDVQDDKAVLAEETGTVSLLKESTAVNGLDFFA
ncbi:MAG: flagellar hook-length control protein FliK [Thermodesulfobacteriota bacterium]|nr:flagellar hook-length control protein FliK [Thermodesulfobacteriota bacterium]